MYGKLASLFRHGDAYLQDNINAEALYQDTIKKGMQCHELHPFYFTLKVYSPFFIFSRVTWYFALFSAATRSTAFCCMAIAWSFLPSL